jgi:hypothetical protein
LEPQIVAVSNEIFFRGYPCHFLEYETLQLTYILRTIALILFAYVFEND